MGRHGTPQPEPRNRPPGRLASTAFKVAGFVAAGAVVGSIGFVLGMAVKFEADHGSRPVAAMAAPQSTPTPTPTPSPSPTRRKPVKGDLSLSVRILGRDCYQTIGCSVTYRIVPQIMHGAPFRDATTYEVTYRVRGTTKLEEGTFTLRDGVAQVAGTEMTTTADAGVRLTAAVTRIEAMR